MWLPGRIHLRRPQPRLSNFRHKLHFLPGILLPLPPQQKPQPLRLPLHQPGRSSQPCRQYMSHPAGRTHRQTPVPLGDDGLPVEHYIYGLLGHKQYFKLGCEAAATHDWAWYFGFNINEFEFQNKLPISRQPGRGFCWPCRKQMGTGTSIRVWRPCGTCGTIVAGRIRCACCTASRIFRWRGLKQQIAADQPVIVWVIGNMVGGIPSRIHSKRRDKK